MSINPQQIDPTIMKAVEALKADCELALLRKKAGLQPVTEYKRPTKWKIWAGLIGVIMIVGCLETIVEWLMRI